MNIDLHVHTRVSDGEYPLWRVIELALQKDISLLAITDHDTLSAFSDENIEIEKKEEKRLKPSSANRFDWDGFIKKGDIFLYKGITIVPGVEFSARHEDKGKIKEIHILGLYLDQTEVTEKLGSYLTLIKNARRKRVKEMGRRHGIDVDRELTPLLKYSQFPSRLHLGRVLYNWGKRKSGEAYDTAYEAMNNHFSRGSKNYEAIAPYSVLKTADEIIRFIVESNGIPVWAHPESTSNIATISKHFRDIADGRFFLEAHSGNFNPDQMTECTKIARELDIPIMYGSDFHGFPMKRNPIGVELDDGRYETLMKKIKCFRTR